jgi:phage I-like protein
VTFRFALAAHSIQLPDQAGDWYHMIPAGVFMGYDGRGPYDLADPSKVLAAFAARGADLCVDYNHQTLSAIDKQGPVPAAGWIKELQFRETGMWARIEWTEAAQACLDAKEYRYLSPVFRFSKTTGEVMALDGAGLTNDPNLHLQAAASRQGDFMDELLERLRYLLNLPLTTTTDEILAQLDKLKAMITASAATQAAAAAMSRALDLPETTGLVELSTALHSRITQGPDPSKWVPIAEFQAVNSRLAGLDASQKAESVERLVTAAMAAGKVSPSMEAWARDYASRNPEGFQAYAASAPVLTPGSLVAGEPPPGTTVVQDADFTAMCRMFGHEPQAIATAMKEE